MKDDLLLRKTFDQVALLYNEIRPRYLDALFSALVKATGLTPKAKLLEIGPGTGQATKPLAALGYDIIGVELGASLADVAMRELRQYPNVRIVNAAFEDIKLPAGTFDLVFAATSFHWIKPELRFLKPHQILKHRGHLAIIHTHYISDEQGDVFFETSQSIYDRYNFTDKNRKPSLPKAREVKPAEMDERLFHLTHFQGFPVIFTYSAKEFSKLLNTYSNHLVASKQVRDNFSREIEDLINEKFNGSIDRHFLMTLTVAQKSGSSLSLSGA
jgi:SAM-dependent methyltransferase